MVGKRYAVADLHGQIGLYLQIKEYINEYDVVYALGDFGDRGPEPWATLQLALDDPQFVYLMGNHDYMLIKAMEQYMEIVEKHDFCNIWDYIYDPKTPIGLLHLNGGVPTLEGWTLLKEEERMKYYFKLKQLPLELRLAAEDERHFIYLTHAGYTPQYHEPHNVEDFVWNRNHFYEPWLADSKHIMAHGHTPCQTLRKDLNKFSYEYEDNGYIRYFNGMKVCIDMGAPYTGETILLNIDTLEGKKFKIGENVNGTEKN